MIAMLLVANVVVAATTWSESDGVDTFGGERSVIYWGWIDTATATSRRCGIDTVSDTSIISGLVIAVTARSCVCVGSSTVGESIVISGPVVTVTDTSRRCGIHTVGDTSVISGLVVSVTSR